MVEKNGQYRRAEVLSKKTTKSGMQFYCNFDQFNKRLDEWVPLIRVDFSQEVEWPNPDKDKLREGKGKKGSSAVPSKKSAVSKKAQKRPGNKAPSKNSKREKSMSISEANTPLPSTENVDLKIEENERGAIDDNVSTPATGGDEIDIDDCELQVTNTAAAPQKKTNGLDTNGYTREKEIEKLRTSGSMTQNPTEIARIRNISKVQFGKHDLYPWYFSPYPEPYSLEDIIYICEFCLSYFNDTKAFSRHRRKCTLLHPPGNEIYRDDHVSFFEIDGRRQRTWCRNLCLLSKMFLDHKTLYYDVDPFLFYIMTVQDEHGCHVVGYFSKEKESADGYNVACILTLPQYQRKGFGRLLIQFSYELSKIEKKLGSPEKPLSDLGLLSYRQYWSENILDLLIEYNEREEKISIETISDSLSMIPQDVEHTLQALKMQVYHRSEHKLVIPDNLIQQRERQKLKKRRVLDPAKIQWRPPVFSAASRTWGW